MSPTEHRYFRIDWYHSFPDEPIKYFEQVDAEGAVVRTVKKSAAEHIVWDSIFDSDGMNKNQTSRTNLIDCSFDSLKYDPHPETTPKSDFESGPYLTKINKQTFEDVFLNAKTVGQREI